MEQFVSFLILEHIIIELRGKHPKIQDLLLNLESFRYASSLDLNMRYFHIKSWMQVNYN